MLVSGVQHSDSTLGATQYILTVYLLSHMPNLALSSPLSLPVTIGLFSIAVSLFLLYIYIHLYYLLDFTCK